jgi:hypothetical protein
MPTEFLAVHNYYAVNLDQILLAQADGLVIDQRRFAGLIRATARKTRPVISSGGRPSKATLVLEVFQARRARREPYRGKSAEAKGITDEWPDYHPDIDAPALSTIRRHLSNCEK